MSDITTLEQLYPDVLGAITRDKRVNLEAVQCALGIFPKQAYLNQPIEAILLLQNMIDQPVQVKVSLSLPPQDKKGNLLVLDTPWQVIPIDMQPGEVGILRIPIIALPPTQPGTSIPVHVAVRTRPARPGQLVRPRTGGVPPLNVPISPYKLQALRDINFDAQVWEDSPDILTAHFDIAPKRLPPCHYSLNSRYETLWTIDAMTQELELLQTKIEEAQEVASAMTTTSLFWAILYTTEEHFMQRGLALHPGELKAIAKIITYTLSEACGLEQNFTQANTRWFQKLCSMLLREGHVADLEPGELASRHLYDAAIYDAVLLGFEIIQPRVNEDLGSPEERRSYAEQLCAWLGGFGQPDLNYIYLPLVMAGVAVNSMVGYLNENPWVMVQELRQCLAERMKLVNGEGRVVFNLLTRILTDAEQELTRMKYSRPGVD